jgi:poly(3-hydroxybutyrate) depolymerase
MSYLPLEKICGTTTRYIRSLKDDDCDDRDDNNNKAEECNRKYELYIPEILCDDNVNDNDNDNTSYYGSLPLVFAVHCLGCQAAAMEHFEDIAKKYNFILVRPEGIKQSWNAKYCCGYALNENIDDVGFLTQIIDDLEESFRFINKTMTYGVGWSNGAFMVTYASHLFRAVSPISGYMYDYNDILDDDDYDVDSSSRSRPKGLFQHHSLNDRMVSYNGCCDKSKCCCGISSSSSSGKNNNNHQQCTSVDQAFDYWNERNKCSGDVTTTYTDKERGIECRAGVGCTANTTLCVYEHSGHFNSGGSFSRSFPMFQEVGEFFARDACSMNQGQWDTIHTQCDCDDDGGTNNNEQQSSQSSSLSYCSAVTSTSTSTTTTENINNLDSSLLESSSAVSSSSTNMMMLGTTGTVIVTVVTITFLCRRYLLTKNKIWTFITGNSKEKRGDWERVPLSDDEEATTEIELQRQQQKVS